MDGRLAEMLRFYATLHWGPNVRGRTTFKCRLDAARSFEDVLMCSELVPVDALTEVGRELAATQASLKSAEASRTVMENKLFSEQGARANAETWAQQFSGDRDAAHKEIELVKSREASLNAQTNEMNAVIKNLTKEVNHARSEYLVGIQAFKKSHENLHRLLSLTDPKETALTIKLREHNRELVRRVKCLEKANSALSSRLRLDDMDPEALVLKVEGLELDNIDWETLAPDPQTHRAPKAVYQVGLENGHGRDTLADDIARAKVRFAEMRAEKQRKAEEAAAAAVVVTDAESTSSSAPSSAAPEGPSQSSTVPPAYSPPASAPPASPVSGGKKGKAKQRRAGSDNEGVNFGGGDSGEDAPEEGPVTQVIVEQAKCSRTRSSQGCLCSKKVDVTASDSESMTSPRRTPKRKAAMSSKFRSSFRWAAGSRSDIKSLTSESSPGQSVKYSSSKSKQSRSKKTNTKHQD
ncbi:hypothetical protein PHMEG_00031072 [Phytophthora megakarya]|uniref:Uncharacterized protein n=1 Tax=Phytophthora megakarya TaxID=4795 RepID=A0A225UZ58_9STRA|nr:hypothetical protein PHMEG_00031072 [Phytophthora megakarya]